MAKFQLKVLKVATDPDHTIFQTLQSAGIRDIGIHPFSGTISFTGTGKFQSIGELTDYVHKAGHSTRVLNTNSHKTRIYLLISTLLTLIAGFTSFFLPKGYATEIILLISTTANYLLLLRFFQVNKYFLMPGVIYPALLTLIAISALFFSAIYFNLFGGEITLFYWKASVLVTLVLLAVLLYEQHSKNLDRQFEFPEVAASGKASMIAYDAENTEHIFPVDACDLKTGDLILITEGEIVPADTKILSGVGTVCHPAFRSGSPAEKQSNDLLLSGYRVQKGRFKGYVILPPENSFQQRLADAVKTEQSRLWITTATTEMILKIIAVVIMVLAAVNFIVNYFFGLNFSENLIRSATIILCGPAFLFLFSKSLFQAALIRPLQNGMLFRFSAFTKKIHRPERILFEPAEIVTNGNTTTGAFHLASAEISAEAFKSIAFQILKFSGGSLAAAVKKEWKQKNGLQLFSHEKSDNTVSAKDKAGNFYKAVFNGSNCRETDASEKGADLLVLKNETLIGWVIFEDKISAGAKSAINYFKSVGIDPFLLRSEFPDYSVSVARELQLETLLFEEALKKSNGNNIFVLKDSKGRTEDRRSNLWISLADKTNGIEPDSDILVFENGLEKVVSAFKTWKQIHRRYYRFTIFGIILLLLVIILAAMGLFSPGLAFVLSVLFNYITGFRFTINNAEK